MPADKLSGQLFISDLDGTLLLPSRRLGQRTQDVLTRLIEAGGHFTVATGRSAQSAAEALGSLQLPLDAIVHNGAMTINLTTGIVSRLAPLSGPTGARLFGRAVEAGMAPAAYVLPTVSPAPGEVPRLLHGPNPNRPTRRYLASVGAHHPLVEDRGPGVTGYHVLSLLLLDDPGRMDRFFSAECDPLEDVVSFPGRSAYTPGLGVGEITAAAASKATAARRLCQQLLGRGLEAVVAFGDNRNDLPLLEAAGQAFAPPGAPEEVLQRIDGRIDPPSDEGVARHLERLFD